MTDEREKTQSTESADASAVAADAGVGAGAGAGAETEQQQTPADTGIAAPAPSLELPAGAFRLKQPRPIVGPGARLPSLRRPSARSSMPSTSNGCRSTFSVCPRTRSPIAS